MEFVEFLQSWGVPAGIVTGILIFIAFLNFIYFLMDKGGKTATGFLNIVKLIKKKREAKKAKEQAFEDAINCIKEMSAHTTPEAIARRDKWMQWVNDRAVTYDSAVCELKSLEAEVVASNKLSETVFIQMCRNKIIDFSYKVRDEHNRYKISREEFEDVFEIERDYEEFNTLHNRVNGKTNRAMDTIRRHYREFDDNHYFLEDFIESQDIRN